MAEPEFQDSKMVKHNIETLSKEEYETATNFIIEEIDFILKTIQRRHPQLTDRDIHKLIKFYLQ